MKIISALALSALLFLANPAASQAPLDVSIPSDEQPLPPLDPLDPAMPKTKNDFSVDPSTQGRQNKQPGGFGVNGLGGRLHLCPTGDCKQSIIDITLRHLQERTSANVLTTNRIKNFGVQSFNWSLPVVTRQADGVNVTTSSFNGTLTVDGSQKLILYKAQASFYDGNSSAMNGQQIIRVPAGGLKLAVWIENWPFLNDSNKLHLGLRVVSRNKKGDKGHKGTKIPGFADKNKTDRVVLQDAMFFDSPTLAQVDNAMVTIDSYVFTAPDAVIMDYAFPKFTKLFYDPVLSSDDGTTASSTTADPAPAVESMAPTVTSAIAAVATSVMLLAAM